MFHSQKEETPTSPVEKKESENQTTSTSLPSRTIQWGSNTLSGGVKSGVFQSSGLFGSAKKEETNASEKKEKTEKKESFALKWGSGKTSLLEKATVSPTLVERTPIEHENKKEDNEKEDIVFQMRVKAYILEDNEYRSRGKGNLKIIRFHGEETKYQIVLRREGEEGGVGTVLVFNSLLYKSTPVKEMGDGFLLITLPSAEGKLTSYLFKPVSDHSLSDLKKGIEDSIASI